MSLGMILLSARIMRRRIKRGDAGGGVGVGVAPLVAPKKVSLSLSAVATRNKRRAQTWSHLSAGARDRIDCFAEWLARWAALAHPTHWQMVHTTQLFPDERARRRRRPLQGVFAGKAALIAFFLSSRASWHVWPSLALQSCELSINIRRGNPCLSYSARR